MSAPLHTPEEYAALWPGFDHTVHVIMAHVANGMSPEDAARIVEDDAKRIKEAYNARLEEMTDMSEVGADGIGHNIISTASDNEPELSDYTEDSDSASLEANLSSIESNLAALVTEFTEDGPAWDEHGCEASSPAWEERCQARTYLQVAAGDGRDCPLPDDEVGGEARDV